MHFIVRSVHRIVQAIFLPNVYSIIADYASVDVVVSHNRGIVDGGDDGVGVKPRTEGR